MIGPKKVAYKKRKALNQEIRKLLALQAFFGNYDIQTDRTTDGHGDS